MAGYIDISWQRLTSPCTHRRQLGCTVSPLHTGGSWGVPFHHYTQEGAGVYPFTTTHRRELGCTLSPLHTGGSWGVPFHHYTQEGAGVYPFTTTHRRELGCTLSPLHTGGSWGVPFHHYTQEGAGVYPGTLPPKVYTEEQELVKEHPLTWRSQSPNKQVSDT